MRSRLDTPYGPARIAEEDDMLVAIHAATECAALYAQGYVAGHMRLWQLELTRRVADGALAEWFGPGSLPTDRFHRDLGLRELARRECARDAGSEQARHIAAYVEGVNHAMDSLRWLPVEFALVGCRPRAFTAEDVHLIAQLKYFINSPWQFELLHTLVSGALGPHRAAQLFSTVADDGSSLDPLPRNARGEWDDEIAELVEAGLAGLDRLGLASPDLGSNAIAIGGARTACGAPLLLSDPHMGNVNPGYNLLCKLVTDDGLAVVGSHFPGAPGIVVGRNRDCAWGMVGLMADNQDLCVARIDADATRVLVEGVWQPLAPVASEIAVRGAAAQPHTARACAFGRLVRRRGEHALFLRWPALDNPIGGISLSALARARDWDSFRDGVSRLTNAPMMVVYADRHGHIGWQAIGLIPRRPRPLGSLVQSLDAAAHRWQGYHAFDELPHGVDPPTQLVTYANQYARAMFDGWPHLSNRWHPPSRAWRIGQLLEAQARHDAASACALQDDRIDVFFRHHREIIGAWLPEGSPLAAWDGDTRDTGCALLFERWMAMLTTALVRGALPAELADRYADAWPAHRWNVVAILRDHAAEWNVGDVPLFARAAYERALADRHDRPFVEFRHTLRRHPLGRLLFTAHHPYDGGSRETVHVARRNTDFLTTSQAGGGGAANYNFGPAFKLVHELSEDGPTHYLINTPARGVPFGLRLRRSLRRWREGRRGVTRLLP